MKKLKYGHEVSHTSKVIYSRNNEGIFSLRESAIYFPGISVKLRFVMHGVLTKFSSKRPGFNSSPKLSLQPERIANTHYEKRHGS